MWKVKSKSPQKNVSIDLGKNKEFPINNWIKELEKKEQVVFSKLQYMIKNIQQRLI